MKYLPPSNGEKFRTDDYRGTITSLDDPQLKAIKDNVAAHNAHFRATSREYGRKIGQLLRVRLMPRGPRAEAAKADYKWKRAYDSYLPQRHATHYDVYVGQDDHNQRLLVEELETGMTQGELAKKRKLQEQIWRLDMKGLNRIRIR